MRFHLTQKLAKKAGLHSLPEASGETHELGIWYAHLFRVERRQYVLFTNPATAFSVLDYGRGIVSGETLFQAFSYQLQTYLNALGLYPPYLVAVGAELKTCEFCKTADRSTLGIMNDNIDLCKCYRDDGEGAYVPVLMHRMNETPHKTKAAAEYFHPLEVFQSRLRRSIIFPVPEV